jgi:hypothetical protein
MKTRLLNIALLLEHTDLSAGQPGKVKDLVSRYDAWAARIEVVPFARLFEINKQKK